MSSAICDFGFWQIYASDVLTPSSNIEHSENAKELFFAVLITRDWFHHHDCNHNHIRAGGFHRRRR
jgi:hypothetical protein